MDSSCLLDWPYRVRPNVVVSESLNSIDAVSAADLHRFSPLLGLVSPLQDSSAGSLGGGRMPRKRRIDQHRADADGRQHRRRPDLFLILDNIRSLTNVGSIFRAADGFGVKKIYLCGITPAPPRPEITKISLGAEETTEWEQLEDPAMAVRILQNDSVTVLALEQTEDSLPIYDKQFPHPLAIVVGHEVVGVDEQVIHLCDGTIEIPMFGSKHSHNVATSAGIVLSEIRRQWLSLADPTPWEGSRAATHRPSRTEGDAR